MEKEFTIWVSNRLHSKDFTDNEYVKKSGAYWVIDDTREYSADNRKFLRRDLAKLVHFCNATLIYTDIPDVLKSILFSDGQDKGHEQEDSIPITAVDKVPIYLIGRFAHNAYYTHVY
jgi:hypothetical protein